MESVGKKANEIDLKLYNLIHEIEKFNQQVNDTDINGFWKDFNRIRLSIRKYMNNDDESATQDSFYSPWNKN